jgi:hypothetical protein
MVMNGKSLNKFFYLKIGKSNTLADEWLSGKNPLKKPAVVIFYGRKSLQDLIPTNRQVKDFYESSLPGARDHVVMLVVSSGKAWFLKPAGKIVEIEPPKNAAYELKSSWKMMPVQIILLRPQKDIPLILAGINSNKYLSQGTYREITNSGNIMAIYSVLNLPLPQEYMGDGNCSAEWLLGCLSSVELETLVAKVFEASRCFVPAYRGGCIRDIDIIVHNDHSTDIQLEGLIVPSKSNISIQIKGLRLIKKRPDNVDCLIGLKVMKLPGCYDAEWLLRQVQSFPAVAQWLKRSLNWLPKEYLSKFIL